jgi:BirA family transcriptional regulator, biotin operon repressor / biotin---[acetyl-CoA-carboxylase] ligase
MTEADSLSTEAVYAALTTTWVGRPAHFRPETSSTNDELLDLARAGAPAGTLLVADYQRQGKGRLNRRWEAPPGTSLLCSLLFRPEWPVEMAPWLMMMAGLAAAEAVQSLTGLEARLKWPNDLVLASETGGWKKAGGILLNAIYTGRRLSLAILGSGINVNLPAELLPKASTPPTSLLVALGRPVSRVALLAAYLTRLEHHYQAAGDGTSPREAWQARLVTLSRPVTISSPRLGQTLRGTAEATDEWGSLLVRDAGGRLHTIAAGDVSLRSDLETV